jgi:catechol 2,3-dioxygenase-like lactoylglutathione lyase family enzyme
MGLSDAKVGPAVPVSDMGRAKGFYEGKLGLSGGEDTGDGGHDYPCGQGTVLHIFPSPGGAGKSSSTIAGFEVDDIEAIVDELSGNGVSFEHYGEPLNTDDRGVASFGEQGKGAWVRDPDGNVLGLFERA